MSLRARLMALVLLATLLPALLLAWRFFRDSEAEIEAARRTLAMAADSVAADLDQRVQGTAQLHYGLAHSRVLDTTDRDACSAYLSDVRETYPQYTGILTVLPDGKLFCDSLRSGRDLNLSDRWYFKQVIKEGSGLTLEPVFGRLTGNSVLQIVYPARTDTGLLRFILVASLNLQKLAQGSQLQSLHPLPELLLVDHKGTVMVWTSAPAGSPVAGSSIAGTGLFRLAEAHQQGGVAELPGRDGQVQVWAVSAAPSLRDAGLYVMLGLSKQELVAQARQRLKQDLFLLGSATLLLFLGVWLLAEWGIRRQVGRITSMVRNLGAGDLGARIAQPYPRGELGGLMAVLNSTADSLQRQRAAIDELGLRLRQAQKMEAIGTLAGGIAHDFNNILGGILGNLSLAHEEALAGQPTQNSLAQIRRAALRARDLVQRIQSFSRQDQPALTNQLLLPIVDEVLALVRIALPAGVALHTELDPTPLHVAADATQLHQVLMNLCSNAWQSLGGAPGSVTVGLGAVLFGDDPQQRPVGLGSGRHAHLWVSDTGCGIAEADRERIFEPFFTTKGARGGTGLGLSVVHGIVMAHHGSITVDSTPGRGSSFHVYLPLLLQDSEDAAGPASEPAAAPAVAGSGQHVLYIDDDEVMALMVDRLLSRAGYRVSCYTSAQAALAAVRADPAGHDLVVTDFNMPELSGLEVSRLLAAIRPELPVFIISGYIFDELPAQARRAGVRQVIRKQNVLEELAPAIAQVFGSGGR